MTTQTTEKPQTGLTFSAGDMPEGACAVVDRERRTIRGLALPFGVVGNNGWARWRFEKGSIQHPADLSRVKLLRDHLWSTACGHLVDLTEDEVGLWATFKVARGRVGDEVLSLAEDRVLDGLSVGPDFDWDDPERWVEEKGTGVRVVCASHPVPISEISVTGRPAFTDARVESVKASRTPNQEGGAEMPQNTPEGGGTTTATPTVTLSKPDLKTMFSGFATTLADQLSKRDDERDGDLADKTASAIAEAFSKLPIPQPRQVTSVEVVNEPATYRFNGLGHSLVCDSWTAQKGKTHKEREEALSRLRRYEEQTADWADKAADRLATFAADSTRDTDPEIIPPGYRPEMYVGQLPQGRPLVESFSRGAIANANPFTVPKFTSATDMVDPTRNEGDTPDSGTLSLGTITVTPASKAGKFRISREMVDASNPAIDMIVAAALREDYSRKTEQVVADLLELAAGTPTVDPTISTGGVYLATATGGGEEFIDAVVDAMAQYWFRRFAMPNRLVLGRDGYRYSATAKDTSGRYILPRVGATDTIGTGGPLRQGLDFDGLIARPAWALSTTEQDGYLFNSADAWFWESPLLEFRFEEKAGPENVELAVFGYSAAQILRPAGFTAIAYTYGS